LQAGKLGCISIVFDLAAINTNSRETLAGRNAFAGSMNQEVRAPFPPSTQQWHRDLSRLVGQSVWHGT
jgi:hypothetical protein